MTYFKLLVIIFFINSYAAKAQEIKKPNILWITIEDTSPQFIGAYGNKDASTPNIDKLAREGTRFTNAFSTGTVCSPSRSCIITGVKTYELGTGNHRSGIIIPEYIKGFPHYLKKEGYYVTNNYKTDYNIKGKKFLSEAWDESSNKAGWWNRKDGQPFFAVFNYMESHQSRTMTWPYERYQKEIFDQLKPEERIGDNDFKMPPIYHDSPEMRKQFARVYNSIKFTDNEIGEILARLEKDHLKDSTIIFFYADHGEGMPRGKTNGIDYGYRVPMVIWFPPMYKNLSPWGKAGAVTEELIDFEDLAPTVISLAGGNKPDYLKGRTLIGKDRNAEVKNLFLSADRSDNGPDLVRTVTNGRYLYSRNFMPYMPELKYIRYMEEGVIKQEIRKDYKTNNLNDLQVSLLKPRAPEVLYDLQTDPWETKNLANDLNHQILLKEFRKSLEKNIIAHQDILFMPEYETNKIPSVDKSTAYEYRKDSLKYPIRTIYNAVKLSGFRSAINTQKQIKFLTDKNDIVRYWALMGLKCQNSTNLLKFKKQLITAMNDKYPPAAITAAAIVYDVFKDKNAKNLLNNTITNDNQDLALIAINYLLYLNPTIQPFLENIKKVQSLKTTDYNVKAACGDFLLKLGLLSAINKPED